MTTNESSEIANLTFIFTFSVGKVTLLIRIWFLGGVNLINFREIRTFSKIKVPIRTKKLELVPIKTCPEIKDPCRHSALGSLNKSRGKLLLLCLCIVNIIRLFLGHLVAASVYSYVLTYVHRSRLIESDKSWPLCCLITVS